MKDINKSLVPIIKVKESNEDRIMEFTSEDILKNIQNDKTLSDDLKREVESVSQICLSRKACPSFLGRITPISWKYYRKNLK